ncbi:tetratricopeptide repeat protein [Flavobacterium agrisoli]|uniref:Tetratricopeptide repeat protein n=1 Tax=Flavobacterium agrisoli TaxID=2793066 RepID=A0A934UIV1_9FLAO|nr:tetratricopeptide repeat protein [Flavobacterium agrisoli]MBK0369227.1 tetratricopeptide repeat protein [Flavobacterium agrisoli]
MNKFKIFTLGLMVATAAVQAQDLTEAKKAIDAEQFEKAKSLLKNIIKDNPKEGKASFLLGNVYLAQTVVDSAKLAYNSGLKAEDDANFNYIGLGQIDLNNKKVTEARSNFELAAKDMRRKDVEEFIYIGRAYLNAENPDCKSAITIINRALAIEPQNAEALLALGDAHYCDKNQNEAYKAYSSAYDADKTLLRAKMQMGVLLKGANSWEEAIKSYNEVIAVNPNYGPVYRELAETYYRWARNKPAKAGENMQKALTNYDKYMSLTDYSIHSRMRRADFLILIGDYKALETEANKMIELDKVNPRIYRYLGYAAYENGNVDVAIKSMNDFINNPDTKKIASDYMFLGLAKIKKGMAADQKSVDATAFNEGLGDIKKGIALDATMTDPISKEAKDLFGKRIFKEAALLFEFGANVKDSSNYLEDNLYFGLSAYYANVNADPKDMDLLKRGDAAFDRVLVAKPDYYEAFLYKARINSAMDNDAVMVTSYEKYLAAVNAKGAEEVSNPATKAKIIEAYNNMGASFANTDKAKAMEYFNKSLVLDPTNQYATESLKSLQQ